ncbi:hypothetical protein EMGBD2_14280 [Nitrospirota bacterium]|nr:hypothetical protein EMGBD2_14280 [Nitrospirota bacterium]
MRSSERVPYLDTIIRVLLAVYIAVLPFKSLLIVERNGFLVLCSLLVGWCAINRRLFYSRTPYDMPLLAFVVWVGLTIPFAVVPSYSGKEYGKLLQQLVIFYAVIYFFKELRARQALVGLIGIVAVVVTAYGLSQFTLSDPQSVVSFFSAEVWLTTFLVMVIPFALVLGLGDGPLEFRSGGAVAAGMMLVCLITTQSRAGLVGLVGELWVIAWFIRSVSARIVVVLVTVGVVAVMALVLSDGATGVRSDIANALPIKQSALSAFHRFEIWGFAMSEIVNHWLVGIGYGNLSYLFSYGQDQEVVMLGHYPIARAGTHNIVLYLALHVGLPGLLLFGWLMVRVMRTTAAAYRHAQEWRSKAVLLGTLGSVVGLMLRLQFDQMLVGSLAVFFWVLLALAVLSYPSCNRVAVET